jgi:hypothetical protein
MKIKNKILKARGSMAALYCALVIFLATPTSSPMASCEDAILSRGLQVSFKPSNLEISGRVRPVIRMYLSKRWEGLSRLPGNERMHGFFYQEIEGIPLGLKPSIFNPSLRQLVVEAHQFLQRKDLYLEYFSSLYVEVLEKVRDLGLQFESSTVGALPREVTLMVISEKAKRHGWEEIVKVPLDPSNRFDLLGHTDFRRFLKKGQLFLDPAGRRAQDPQRGLYHSESSHLLQFLFLAEYLEKNYGPYAMRDSLIPYLATKAGYDLWEHMFDRAGSERSDLRFPAVFYDLHLTGENSIFGLY